MELFANLNETDLKALRESLRDDKLLFSYLLKIREAYNDLNDSSKKELLDDVVALYEGTPKSKKHFVTMPLDFSFEELERLPNSMWDGHRWETWNLLSSEYPESLEEVNYMMDFDRLVDCKIMQSFFKSKGLLSNIWMKGDNDQNDLRKYILQIQNVDYDIHNEVFRDYLARL